MPSELPHQIFADHSFYTGATTVAAKAGLEDSVIHTLGNSDAFLLYMRTPKEQLAQYTCLLAKS